MRCLLLADLTKDVGLALVSSACTVSVLTDPFSLVSQLLQTEAGLESRCEPLRLLLLGTEEPLAELPDCYSHFIHVVATKQVKTVRIMIYSLRFLANVPQVAHASVVAAEDWVANCRQTAHAALQVSQAAQAITVVFVAGTGFLSFDFRQ